MSEWDPSNNLNYQEEAIEGAMEAHDITTPLSVLPLVSFGEKKKKSNYNKNLKDYLNRAKVHWRESWYSVREERGRESVECLGNNIGGSSNQDMLSFAAVTNNLQILSSLLLTQSCHMSSYRGRSAHHDHLGTQTEGRTTISNAAGCHTRRK